MLDTEYDLVIVGYETRGFLEKMIWGSWATRIAHEVPTSVLIIRDRRDMINHVLVGISGGGFTEACVAWAGHIATAFDAQVTLVHTSQMPALMYGGLEEVRETLTEFLQTDTAEAHAMKQAVARLDDIGARTEVKLVYGLPERELLRLMQDLDIDLLVIGSWWAAQPVRRAVLRNIAEKLLLHTRRPVLVVRPPTV
jgi:nucleotide-binding universal stress UspA family protein